MRHYILIFLALLLGSKELLAAPPFSTIYSVGSSDYIAADGDYIAVNQTIGDSKDAIVVYSISTGKMKPIDYVNSGDYCDNSFATYVKSAYPSAAGAAECAAFSCSQDDYSNLNIEGNYLVFRKSNSRYKCEDNTLDLAYTMELNTAGSPDSIGIYDLTSNTLSSISVINPSGITIIDSSVIWIENGDKVNMYNASTATKSTIVE